MRSPTQFQIALMRLTPDQLLQRFVELHEKQKSSQNRISKWRFGSVKEELMRRLEKEYYPKIW